MDFELNGIELPLWKRNLIFHLKTFPKSSHGSADFKIIGLLHVGLLGWKIDLYHILRSCLWIQVFYSLVWSYIL